MVTVERPGLNVSVVRSGWEDQPIQAILKNNKPEVTIGCVNFVLSVVMKYSTIGNPV